MSTPNFIQLQKEFCAYLRKPLLCQAPENTEKNINIYRKVSLYSVESLLEPTFPVLRSILSVEQWQHLIVQFFEDWHVKSPISSDVPKEFVAFLEQLPNLQPPFAAELAHYEWVELAVMLDQGKIRKNQKLNLKHLILNPTLKLLNYQFPVQKICTEFQPAQPLEFPVFLAVYRDKNDDVQFMELNALSAKLLELIQSLTDAHIIFDHIIKLLPHLNSPTISTHGELLLKQLFENDVLL